MLERCESVVETAPLLEFLGFDPDLLPLAGEPASRLGLGPGVVDPHIGVGSGALRVLVFQILPGERLRPEITGVARELSRRAPQLLWLIAAVDRVNSEIAIATIDSSARHLRIAALLTRRLELVDSDTETICALEATRTHSDVFTHSRWVEILGRESVSRRFFRALERTVDQLGKSLQPQTGGSEAAEAALIFVSRLLFLSFVETRGWLNGDRGFLVNRYADCMMSGGKFHSRVLAPLFFGTLNTHTRNRAASARSFGRIPFLNGGLFARTPVERRLSRSRFTDEALGDVFGELLSRYRFTAREDSSGWTEAAIDPEMLGKAFEGLMTPRDRKRSGAFYTPQSLVSQVTRSALTYALVSPGVPESAVCAAFSGRCPSETIRERLLASVIELRVLDPACGSGAFLVYALEEISRLRRNLGDTADLHQIRRALLASTIFGVDINPTAVWLCELRLWLSMAIEDPEDDPMRVAPLPNLDRNIRVGDSLTGNDFSVTCAGRDGRTVSALRSRYARSTGPRKRSLARALDARERALAVANTTRRVARLRDARRDTLELVRSRDLFGERPHPGPEIKRRLADFRITLDEANAELRRLSAGGALPFSFESGFADVDARGGFDIVVGNPPWVRTHHLDRASRAVLRRSFSVYRNSAWITGSEAASAGRGFASQVDASALFLERSIDLLKPRGIAALIVPAKIWRSLAGGGVRELLLHRSSPCEIHDLTGAKAVFDAAVYPSILVTRKSESPSLRDAVVTVHRDGSPQCWSTKAGRLPFDSSPGSPWLFLPEPVRHAFDAVSSRGNRLTAIGLGRPTLGVKTGCNEAFIVRGNAPIESALLRPLVRGDQMERWRISLGDERIIWTHGSDGNALKVLPPLAKRWLSRWRRDLESRTDARGTATWWTLFRTESADCSQPRVVWSDIGRFPRAAVIRAGQNSVAINSCYVIRCSSDTDAHALAALINSDIIGAWLAAIAEPARGGYRRYMGWTMSIMPVPLEWSRARRILAPIGCRASNAGEADEKELHAAVLAAFGLEEVDVAPLLEWSR